MALTASAHSKADSDFDGNKAGGIETWVYTEVESQTSTQTEIRYIFGFDQDQTYSDTQDFDAWIDGSSVYSSTFSNTKGADSWQYYTTTRTYTRPAYGSPTVYHDARAQVDGIYNGPTSNTGTHDITTGVPAKAGTTLGAPTSFADDAKTSSSITYGWAAPPSAGIGPPVIDYKLQVSTDSGFSTLVYNADVGNVLSKTVTGLNRATTYYARVQAQNSVGYGTWSATDGTTTNATVPDTQAAPTVSTPTSNGFTVNFSAPNNGGSAITSYEQQVSLDNFATVAASFSGTSPKVLTGLLPGKKYRARTRAVNSIGAGAWSPASAEIQTLGGVKIWTGSAWGEGIVRVWDGSTWKVCIVRKWNGSSWVV